MYNPQTKFQNIISPIRPDDFFQNYLGRKALHIPGKPDKFSGLFDWADVNRIINTANIWNANSFKLILDNESVAPAEYMPQGFLNVRIVSDYIEKGASVVLSGMETYAEGSAALAASLQAALGGYSQCNLYCSFQQHPGFLPHFDLMDVFVFQIDGEKDWDIFETQFENPMLKPGCHQMSFSREQHAANKGAIEKKVTMKPGDVLYIPKGKYHAAIATSAHSLHLTYGIEPPRALSFIETVVDSLYKDPLFRQEMPHYDDKEAYTRTLDRLAEQLHAHMTGEEARSRFRDGHRSLSLQNIARFQLPDEGIGRNFRVRTHGSLLKRRGKNWQLKVADRETEISPENATLVEWMLDSELFTRAELLNAFATYGTNNCDTLLKLMGEAGLISEF
ncbi:MAG: hypothetical protein HQ483_19965 [Rhodospirillales bacterium]|nr:hypothetical protein [Rhodospirillales bacterium]